MPGQRRLKFLFGKARSGRTEKSRATEERAGADSPHELSSIGGTVPGQTIAAMLKRFDKVYFGRVVHRRWFPYLVSRTFFAQCLFHCARTAGRKVPKSERKMFPMSYNIRTHQFTFQRNPCFATEWKPSPGEARSCDPKWLRSVLNRQQRTLGKAVASKTATALALKTQIISA